MLGLLGSASAWAQNADLVLSNHVVAPDPVPAGGIATITMTVENNGRGTATGVKLTDTIPEGSQFVSMSANDGGACSSEAPYECRWDSIPFPGARTVTLKVKLPSAKVWINAATVTSTSTDTNASNNGLSRHITVQAAADLTITAVGSHSGSTISAGTPYTYTLNVANNGPDALPTGKQPTVTFNVPAGSSITSRPGGDGWSCTPDKTYPMTAIAGSVGTKITCSRNDQLASGANFPPIVVAAVGNVTGTVAATFDVTSKFLDGNTSNNVATVNQPLSAGTDMAIQKTVSVTAGVAGTLATFTLKASQVGGVAPSGVTVFDTLSEGFDYLDHSASAPWECAFAERKLTCQWPGEYVGGPHSSLPDIVLRANVTGIGDIPNTGHVTTSTLDPVGTNNTSTVSVNNTADLEITKASSFKPVTTNQHYDWNITLTNHGPMALMTGQVLTVTEQIPLGMSLTALPNNANWACSVPNGTTYPAAGPLTMTCRHTRTSPLNKGGKLPVLKVAVINTQAGTLTNTACLALEGIGPTEAGDAPGFKPNCKGAGVLGTTPDNSADLKIEKQVVGPNSVAVGQNLTYRLIASNLSTTVNATKVHVYDTLNDLLMDNVALPGDGLISVSPSQGTCTPTPLPANVGSATVDCDLGTLRAGGQATIDITIRPANTTKADIVRPNTATINSLDVGDPNRSNNSATVNSTVQPRVDMTVSKTVNPHPVRVGRPMVYTISAENRGPSTATNVRITDVMPPNTVFISADTPSDGGTCGKVPEPGSSLQTLECSWDEVKTGGQRTVSFTVRPLEAALTSGTPEGTITNTVTVATDSTETNENNNSFSISAEVIESLVDILVKKTDSVDPVVLGAMTRYTINIRNAGPSYGTELVMTDTFPNEASSARFSYQGNLTAHVAGKLVEAADLDCDEPAIGAVSGALVCRFPTIAVGEHEEVVLAYDMRAESISAEGDYAGTQGNHVEVAVHENEIELDNNQVVEDTTTRRDPIETDLGLTKEADRPTMAAGEEMVYTLTVVNNGPLESVGAQVIDTLPADMSFVSSTDGCVENAGTVTCAVGTLPVDESRVFRFTARLSDPYAATTVVNTARLDAPGDIELGNNEDEVVTKVPKPENLTAVPTMGEWAMLMMIMAVAGFGAKRLRRR